MGGNMGYNMAGNMGGMDMNNMPFMGGAGGVDPSMMLTTVSHVIGIITSAISCKGTHGVVQTVETSLFAQIWIKMAD